MSHEHIWVKFSTLIPDSVFIHCWFSSLNLFTNHRGLGDIAREDWGKEETEIPSLICLQSLNHLPHLVALLHFSCLLFYHRCCGWSSSCCPMWHLLILKYAFQRLNQLEWGTQLCHAVGPLEPGGYSCVQHWAASGLLIQRPPLQPPRCQHLDTCSQYIWVPPCHPFQELAERLQASVRTRICSTRTSVGCLKKTLPALSPWSHGL